MSKTPKSDTQEKLHKKNIPLLCDCDGSWHITGFTDDTGLEYSIDVDAQVRSLIESAKRDGADAIERLLPNPDKIDSYDRSDLLDVLDDIRDRLTQLKQSEESI